VNKVQNSKDNKMKQNEAHGHMIRINTYLRAYFQYRELNRQLKGRSDEEEQALRATQEAQLISCFDQLFAHFDDALKVFSPIIMSLFLKIFRHLVKNTNQYPNDSL
jgi:hypothetical protein